MNKPQREIPTRRRFSKHAHKHTHAVRKKQRQRNKNNSRLARTAHKHTHTYTPTEHSPNIEPNPTKNAENFYTRTLQRALFEFRRLLSHCLSLSLFLSFSVRDIFGCNSNNNNNYSTRSTSRTLLTIAVAACAILPIHRTHFRFVSSVWAVQIPYKMI